MKYNEIDFLHYVFFHKKKHTFNTRMLQYYEKNLIN